MMLNDDSSCLMMMNDGSWWMMLHDVCGFLTQELPHSDWDSFFWSPPFAEDPLLAQPAPKKRIKDFTSKFSRMTVPKEVSTGPHRSDQKNGLWPQGYSTWYPKNEGSISKVWPHLPKSCLNLCFYPPLATHCSVLLCFWPKILYSYASS